MMKPQIVRSKFMVLLAFVLCLGLFARTEAGFAQVAKTGSIRHQVVSEQKYDEVVKGVALGYAEVDGKKVRYPVAIRSQEHTDRTGKEKLHFYNETGSLVGTVPADYGVTWSRDGKFIGCQTILERTDYDILKDKFSVYSNRMQLLWEIENRPSYYGGAVYALSDADGSAVRVFISTGKLEFIDMDGRVFRTIDLFKDDEEHPTRTSFSAFTKDGRYFVHAHEITDPIIIYYDEQKAQSAKTIVLPPKKLGVEELHPDTTTKKEERMPPQSRRVVIPQQAGNVQSAKAEPSLSASTNLVLIMFDHSGNELWRKFVSLPHVTGLHVSDNGDFIIIDAIGFSQRAEKYYCAISLFNRNSDLIREISFPPNDDGTGWEPYYAFDQNHNVLAIGNANWVKLLSLETGATIWEANFPWEVRTGVSRRIKTIRGLGILHRGDEFAVVLLSFETSIGVGTARPRIIIMNQSGQIVFEQEFPDKKEWGVQSTFDFEIFDNEIMLVFADKVRKINLLW